MEPRQLLVPWLRRGIEAGVFGALLSGGTILAFQFSREPPRQTLPNGLDGAMILTPAVLALAVFTVSFPAFLAATREEAVLGAVAAFLIAADLLMLVSLIVGDTILYHPVSRWLPLGVVSVMLAVPPAIIAVAVAQLTTPLGFGRSAAFRTAAVSILPSLAAVALGARFA